MGDKSPVAVSIYADEIQEVESLITKEKWIYTAAIYERHDKNILDDLIFHRYKKQELNWHDYKEKNDLDIHWYGLRSAAKKDIVTRWFKYLLSDCQNEKKFYFSLLGINVTNLNLAEFGRAQTFNAVYNRFFRSMLKYSLKKFFSDGVLVKNIYHEEGPQQSHTHFDWHTILKLEADEKLDFDCRKIEFLPKSHRSSERSNIIQLCDVLLGLFKDLHLGVDETYNINKKELISSPFIQDLLIDRVIKKPGNTKSSYSYCNRFNISLFPKIKSEPGSIHRKLDNYYTLSKVDLAYLNKHQIRLL